MGKSYKEELSEFKQLKLDPDRQKRIYPKAKKLKPYKVSAKYKFGTYFSEKVFVIGRYATPRDAKQAMIAAEKSGHYAEIICEPPITNTK